MYIGFAEIDDPNRLLLEIILGEKMNDNTKLVKNVFRSR